MISKPHNLQSIDADETFLYLVIDDNAYRIRWEDCSRKLAQRRRMDAAPSG